MKKKIILSLVLALAILCSFCAGMGVGASGQKQVVQATIDPSVKITVDGVEKSFFDANGVRVFPILYNGTTYLPLRDVCEKVAGYTVKWDQATRSTSIFTKPAAEGADLLDIMRAYNTAGGYSSGAQHYMSSDKKTVTVNGYELTHWLQFGIHSWYADNYALASFNLEGKYDTVTFRYYSEADSTLELFGDNEAPLGRLELKAGQLYQDATFPLLKTNQLTFKFTRPEGTSVKAYVYDVRLK